MVKVKNVQMIEVQDWNKLVTETYNRPYDFQQQDDCKSRGTFHLTIPSDYTCEEEMNDEIPEIIDGLEMGVKFKKWLERSPNLPVEGKSGFYVDLWWERNFYPDISAVANDLHEKGLIGAGEYVINIDW